MLEKSKFCIDGLLGHAYGSTFEVQNGSLIKINTVDFHKDLEVETGGIFYKLELKIVIFLKTYYLYLCVIRYVRYNTCLFKIILVHYCIKIIVFGIC